MKRYTVKQLAKLCGVSVRTLHHYDEIDLLKPAEVGENGYRYYGREELLRLQQILFYRELKFSLEDMRALLSSPGFDRVAALRAPRARLGEDVARYGRLICTIDETLEHLEGGRTMDDRALFEGFSSEKQAEYEDWLVSRYGPDMRGRIDASKEKIAAWPDADRRAFLGEIQEIGPRWGEPWRTGRLPPATACAPFCGVTMPGWARAGPSRRPLRPMPDWQTSVSRIPTSAPATKQSGQGWPNISRSQCA